MDFFTAIVNGAPDADNRIIHDTKESSGETVQQGGPAAVDIDRYSLVPV